ncbi:unnamed protein product, partial [Ectocarpus sp. 12 AP-2014]
MLVSCFIFYFSHFDDLSRIESFERGVSKVCRRISQPSAPSKHGKGQTDGHLDMMTTLKRGCALKRAKKDGVFLRYLRRGLYLRVKNRTLFYTPTLNEQGLRRFNEWWYRQRPNTR